MRILASTLLLAGLVTARLNEQQKENLFEFLNEGQEGRTFLSSVFQRITERTQNHLLFSFANLASTWSSPVTDWLAC